MPWWLYSRHRKTSLSIYPPLDKETNVRASETGGSPGRTGTRDKSGILTFSLQTYSLQRNPLIVPYRQGTRLPCRPLASWAASHLIKPMRTKSSVSWSVRTRINLVREAKCRSWNTCSKIISQLPLSDRVGDKSSRFACTDISTPVNLMLWRRWSCSIEVAWTGYKFHAPAVDTSSLIWYFCKDGTPSLQNVSRWFF